MKLIFSLLFCVALLVGQTGCETMPRAASPSPLDAQALFVLRLLASPERLSETRVRLSHPASYYTRVPPAREAETYVNMIEGIQETYPDRLPIKVVNKRNKRSGSVVLVCATGEVEPLPEKSPKPDLTLRVSPDSKYTLEIKGTGLVFAVLSEPDGKATIHFLGTTAQQ